MIQRNFDVNFLSKVFVICDIIIKGAAVWHVKDHSTRDCDYMQVQHITLQQIFS